jgi:serine/threonine protein kinase
MNLMRQLDHKNIMKLYGVFESENSIYITVELLEGGQLFNKIQSRHKFTSEQTRKIMHGLLSGIQSMHSKRIMHRDLKPENILLRYSDDYEVVIADLGLATWADEEEYLFVRCGTPGYVAPEIINIKNLKTKSDPICDVFSAGLIFHILLMGKSVFPGRTYNDVLVQNRACDFNLNTP